MVDINDFGEEKACTYKNEEYLVRDNGAVLRKARLNQKIRKLDNEWTFGKLNEKTGYLEIASVRIHRIVALAFHGEPPTTEHIVDHIDTNRQNNRPSNLRWITRLENVMLNPVTRKRIEYRLGVSVYEFLENPSKHRDAFDVPDFSWMRQVTDAEARSCLENVKRWSEIKSKATSLDSRIENWIYHSQTSNSHEKEKQSEQNITDSLTRLAKQKDWNTPTTFVCCPETIEGDPIQCYMDRLSPDVVFAVNQYGKSRIVKYVCVNNQAILVITEIPSLIKPLALAKIIFDSGYYLHISLGTFFTDEGAEKQFKLAQGLEWDGGDTIDDYC